jgi:hypothetical protein
MGWAIAEAEPMIARAVVPTRKVIRMASSVVKLRRGSTKFSDRIRFKAASGKGYRPSPSFGNAAAPYETDAIPYNSANCVSNSRYGKRF